VDQTGVVTDYYDRHPIGERQILSALARQGKSPEALTPEDLFPLDQDHYGGLAAVEALAERGGITASSRVLDVCAGLGGPARFLAWRYGCRVTGIDLTESRCRSANRLTRMVGLAHRVAFVRGDGMALPFPSASFTAVVSQEGWLHIPDKERVAHECFRVLAPGGRLALTDWTAGLKLTARERDQLQKWMAAVRVESLVGYQRLLARAGFVEIEAEDLTREWRWILRERLTKHRTLREERVARFGRARYGEYTQLFAFFAGLVEAGKIGGGRLSATKR
jgi:ubiquinone/menaquinone biosynthesis C-methylase UbiE